MKKFYVHRTGVGSLNGMEPALAAVQAHAPPLQHVPAVAILAAAPACAAL
jgi:hypothetical protein